MKFIAHRGESAAAPENTLEAFQLAWAQGISTVELDIHLSKDGHIVVMHDANLRRTFGIDALIKDRTLAEIKNFNAEIPTLREVLEILPEHGEIIIEVKAGAVLLEPLKKLLAGYRRQTERLYFFSGLPETKRILPEHQVYWCLANYQPADMRLNPAEMINELRRRHSDGAALWYGSGITTEYIGAFHEAGLQCFAWTVDIPWDAQCLRDAGIDGIISNRAAALKKELSEHTW